MVPKLGVVTPCGVMKMGSREIFQNPEEKQRTLVFKCLGSLRNVLVFERKAHFLSIKITEYSVDFVNVVNNYCSWKRQIVYGIST